MKQEPKITPSRPLRLYGKAKAQEGTFELTRAIEVPDSTSAKTYRGSKTYRVGTKGIGVDKQGNGMREAAVRITAPNFREALFEVKGTAPLVIHRFSLKTFEQMKRKQEQGKSASSRKNREPQDTDQLYHDSRYISRIGGWDGFNASSIRNASISACRLVGFKMVLAKLSIFVVADGWDAKEPWIPLIRIYGKPSKLESMARVETGQPYITFRAAYYDWRAKIRIKWDADQFTLEDVSNLMSRVGEQCGICEGRPDSKNSAGMGWGLFELDQTKA